MSKFQVGDRVVCKWDRYKEPAVIHDLREGETLWSGKLLIKWETSGDGIVSPNELDFLDGIESHPIRTVTRKEIVAGTYGMLFIHPSLEKGEVCVEFLNNKGERDIYKSHTNLTAEQLREAAHTLAQIAEALDDNAD